MSKPSSNQPRLREAWVLFFILGIVMLNYPLLQIFNKPVTVFGIPLLVLYFMLGWPLSIGVIYLFSQTLTNDDDSGQSEENEPGDEE
jgi:hypothetical protein